MRHRRTKSLQFLASVLVAAAITLTFQFTADATVLTVDRAITTRTFKVLQPALYHIS